jgi:tRNA-specific 2-thiouridylase
MAYVVVGKDLARNRLVVGWDRADSPGLYARQCVVGTLSDLSGDLGTRRRVEAQPRYRARAEPAALRPLAGGRLALCFDQPQRALATGQICGFYDGGRLLGGGVFEAVEQDGI